MNVTVEKSPPPPPPPLEVVIRLSVGEARHVANALRYMTRRTVDDMYAGRLSPSQDHTAVEAKTLASKIDMVLVRQ